jgi:HAE1 family hydrophobic/amphiphilic exporter-1
VRLAVIATTLVVLAVFGPVGFISGVIGQFLKPFGFVICFAMIISLFDALTIAPMLSAYFAGDIHAQPTSFLGRFNARLIDGFERVQRWIDYRYNRILEHGVRRPWAVLGMAFVVFVIMMSFGRFVPKTFLPTQDAGEFNVRFDLPPGSSLQAMSEVSRKIDDTIRLNPEVMVTAMKVGNKDGEANQSEIYVQLVPAKKRNQNTSEVKDKIRADLKPYAFANVRVVDFDGVGAGLRPFNINIVGHDQKLLEEYATKIFERLKTDSRLKDVNLDYRPGKPELRVNLDLTKMEQLGVAPKTVGMELRTQLEGVEAAKFRQSGIEYDVRVRLQEDQRNLKQFFDRIYVPNINGSLIPRAKPHRRSEG